VNNQQFRVSMGSFLNFSLISITATIQWDVKFYIQFQIKRS